MARLMTVYAGRCPACRCTRIHRDQGWAEVSILGWTLGAVTDALRPNRLGPLLPVGRFRRLQSRWQAGMRAKPATKARDARKPAEIRNDTEEK